MPHSCLNTIDPTLIPDNPYLLLTPGPLSTSKRVRAALLKDWCTWDKEYNDVVQEIRSRLVALASKSGAYTAVLMQGSGTFSVESAVTTLLPPIDAKVLVLTNGAYGERIAQIASYAKIPCLTCNVEETTTFSLEALEHLLCNDPSISAVAVVHCETTTGILNPIVEIARIVKAHRKLLIVDAMSSFGGIEIDLDALDADVLISSSNKCIQGVPGFGFMLFKKTTLATCQGNARSLSLDAYEQHAMMQHHGGKWRFTSPTHVVRAFAEALCELEDEGGVAARYERYRTNQRLLVEGMEALGFECVVEKALQSPIITSFYSPKSASYDFQTFYARLKAKGFVIYPGKVSHVESFRIGTIGHVFPEDITRLLKAVQEAIFW